MSDLYKIIVEELMGDVLEGYTTSTSNHHGFVSVLIRDTSENNSHSIHVWFEDGSVGADFYGSLGSFYLKPTELILSGSLCAAYEFIKDAIGELKRFPHFGICVDCAVGFGGEIPEGLRDKLGVIETCPYCKKRKTLIDIKSAGVQTKLRDRSGCVQLPNN